MLELLKQRRSIRKYKDTKIEKETLEKLLKAALLAPSSKNKKPVELVVVDDKETLLKLEKCKTKGAIPVKNAPLAIVVIADSELSDVWVEDASIVSTLIQLEAQALGLGSCWVQMRKRRSETEDSEVEVRKVLNIPDKFAVLSIVTIGYKDEERSAYDDSELDFSKIHYNKF